MCDEFIVFDSIPSAIGGQHGVEGFFALARHVAIVHHRGTKFKRTRDGKVLDVFEVECWCGLKMTPHSFALHMMAEQLDDPARMALHCLEANETKSHNNEEGMS